MYKVTLMLLWSASVQSKPVTNCVAFN